MEKRIRSFWLALPQNDLLPGMRSVMDTIESRGGDQDQPADVPHVVASREGEKHETSEHRSTRHPFHECCEHRVLISLSSDRDRSDRPVESRAAQSVSCASPTLCGP